MFESIKANVWNVIWNLIEKKEKKKKIDILITKQICTKLECLKIDKVNVLFEPNFKKYTLVHFQKTFAQTTHLLQPTFVVQYRTTFLT